MLLFQENLRAVVTPAVTRVGGDDVPWHRTPHRGFNLDRWKRDQGKLDIEQTLRSVYAELTGENQPTEISESAEAIVAPFVKTGEPNLPDAIPAFAVDWAAVARSEKAVRQLLLDRARARIELDIEEEAIELLLMQ